MFFVYHVLPERSIQSKRMSFYQTAKTKHDLTPIHVESLTPNISPLTPEPLGAAMEPERRSRHWAIGSVWALGPSKRPPTVSRIPIRGDRFFTDLIMIVPD